MSSDSGDYPSHSDSRYVYRYTPRSYFTKKTTLEDDDCENSSDAFGISDAARANCGAKNAIYRVRGADSQLMASRIMRYYRNSYPKTATKPTAPVPTEGLLTVALKRESTSETTLVSDSISPSTSSSKFSMASPSTSVAESISASPYTLAMESMPIFGSAPTSPSESVAEFLSISASEPTFQSQLVSSPKLVTETMTTSFPAAPTLPQQLIEDELEEVKKTNNARKSCIIL